MYYSVTSSNSRTKMLIDYANILLTIAIGVVFIIIVFLRSRSGMLFSLEFGLGALVNALTSIKSFMGGRKISGIILLVVTLVLLLMALVSWQVMVR